MKISRIRAYRVLLHTTEGRYAWGKGRFTDELDSTIVRIDTDDGIAGYGEVCCPVAPGYTPSFAAGVRAGMSEVVPTLLGEDPRHLKCINAIMDGTLTGHDYAKSGIDMACWDILGKAAGLPLCTLLGGRFGPDFPLYRPVGQDTPEVMVAKIETYRAQGYRAFQLKVGADFRADIVRIRQAAAALRADETLIADANRGWLLHEAMQVIEAVGSLPVYIEQPCASYEECLVIRRKCRNPFVLDESIQSVSDIVRAFGDGAADVINLKLSKLGGITKTVEARNLCMSLGLPVYIDNAKGGAFVTAAMAHLAHSMPSQYLFATTDFASHIKETLADGMPEKVAGRLAAPTGPGLGVVPREAMLGAPLLDFTG